MKLILSFAMFLFVGSSIAQTEAIFLKSKKNNDRLEFYVHNTTNDPVEVRLVFHDVKNLRGRKRSSLTTIPANGNALVKTMKIKGEYSYRYEIEKSYSEEVLASKEKTVENVDLEEGIVVFNKKGCPRCEFLLNFLMKNDIDFQLMDLEKGENKEFMYKLLEESGVHEKRVMTPIVMVDHEISYSHEDLEKFAMSLK